MAEFLRAAWGAQPPKRVGPKLVNVPNGVVHHIGGGDPYPSNVVATLQQIQSMEQHGAYVDIAYNWGVDKDGNLWELRGDVEDGATLGYAGTSFSVLAICNAVAPNFVATPALIAGIAACFRNAQARGVLAATPTIDGHHAFDAHVTQSPTECPGPPLMAEIPQIRQLVAGVPAPTPVHVEVPLTTVATGQTTPDGRDGTATPIPALGVVLLENGATVKGDKPSGPNRTWQPPAPPGGTLKDIAALNVPGHPFVALVSYPNGQTATYRAELP